MTILQLQYFIDICQYQSFSIAASKNYISQPAISNAINALEKELGVLFLYVIKN